MVGRVGYAPTTPAMSMQYSTIELTAHFLTLIIYYFFFKYLNFYQSNKLYEKLKLKLLAFFIFL